MRGIIFNKPKTLEIEIFMCLNRLSFLFVGYLYLWMLIKLYLQLIRVGGIIRSQPFDNNLNVIKIAGDKWRLQRDPRWSKLPPPCFWCFCRLRLFAPPQLWLRNLGLLIPTRRIGLVNGMAYIWCNYSALKWSSVGNVYI